MEARFLEDKGLAHRGAALESIAVVYAEEVEETATRQEKELAQGQRLVQKVSALKPCRGKSHLEGTEQSKAWQSGGRTPLTDSYTASNSRGHRGKKWKQRKEETCGVTLEKGDRFAAQNVTRIRRKTHNRALWHSVAHKVGWTRQSSGCEEDPSSVARQNDNPVTSADQNGQERADLKEQCFLDKKASSSSARPSDQQLGNQHAWSSASGSSAASCGIDLNEGTGNYTRSSPDDMPIHNVVALHRGNGRTATGCEEITVETESAKKLDEVPTISPLQSFESCHSEGKQDDISSVGVPCIDYSSLPHALPENGTPLPELEDPHPPRLPPRNAPYTALPLPPSALWQENFVELLLPISHCLEQKRQTGGQWHGGDISREALDTREESSTERVDHQSDNTEKSFATACSNIAGEGVPNGKPPHPGQRYDTATTVAHKITDEFGRDLDSGFTANFVDAVNAVRQPRAERTSDIAATEDVRTSSEEGTESVEAKSFCDPPENGVETEEPYLRPCTLREIPQVIVPLARRRTKLPCAKPSSSNLSILKILKQVNSSDMRNFSLPINVNEPLSMLQRICEDFEYTNLLSIARTRATSTERLAYVTIFALSAYAGSMERCYKPFNPMLGETFECSHRGFNYIAEQVSHHPPVSAYHAAAHNGDFVCFGTVSPVLSIQGTHVDSCNSGTVTLRLFLPGGGFEDYTWRRPNTRVHNIIFGTMWMEWVGVMTITNHMTSEEAHVSFLPVTSSSSSKASAGSWLSSFQWNAPSANRNLTEPASPPIAQSRRRRSNSVASDSGGGGEAEEQEKVTLGSGRKNDASSRSVSASPPLDTKRGRMNCRSDSWLSKECAGRNGLRGQVLDRAGCPRFFIDGCWSKRLWLTRVGKGSYEEFKQRNRLIEPTTGMNRDQNSGSSPSFSRGGQTSTPQKATHTSRISGRHGSGVVPLQTSRQENGSPEMNFISQTDRTAAEVRVVPADKDQVQVCCEQTRKRDHPSVASTARSKDEADITWNDEDTFFVAWEATLKPPSAKMYYNMPVFAIELNELTEGSQPNPLVVKRGGWSGMAPTDSRFRPDLRKYEDGDSAGAQAEKLRLEEKQRATARSMKGGESAWRPLWFDKGINAVTGLEDWLYNGRYWPERTRPLATSGGMIQPTRGNYCSTHVELSRFAVCPDIY